LRTTSKSPSKRRASCVSGSSSTYDFGAAERHGLIREIPIRLGYDDTYDRLYPLQILTVTDRRGTPIRYEREDSETLATLRIGDPDRTVTGR